MTPEFDQLVARFERFQEQVHRVDQQFADVEAMQRQLAELEVVASSPDRAVTVVAGPSGAIRDIRLTDQALRRPAHALAGELMTTLRQAVAEAARRQAGIVEGALGGGMDLTEQVLETQAQLFGLAKEDLRAATAETSTSPEPRGWTPEARPPTTQQPAPRPQPTGQRGVEPAEDFSDRDFLRGDWRHPARPAGPPRSDDRFLTLYDEEDGR